MAINTSRIAAKMLEQEEANRRAAQTATENNNALFSSAAMVQASTTGVKLAAGVAGDLIAPAGKARVRKKYNSGISL